MKRLLLSVILLTIVSCGEEAASEDDPKVRIEFLLSTVPMRSRSEIVESYLDVEQVGVFAYAQGVENPFVDDLHLQRVRRSWNCDSIFYWDDCNEVPTIFFGYSPCASSSNGISVESTADALRIDYRVPSCAADHPYLLVSYPENFEVSHVEPVCFIMQHPLCAVGFRAEEGGMISQSITIQGIGVHSCLTMLADGSYTWDEPISYGSVECGVGDYAMMIPQQLDDSAVVTVKCDDHVATYSLATEMWNSNEKVDYIIAADSLYRSIPHRELNP